MPEGRPEQAPDPVPALLTAERSSEAAPIEESQRPPIATAPLSFVLVVRDYDRECEAAVAGWIQHLDKLSREYELLLVTDSNGEDAKPRAELLIKQYPRLSVVPCDAYRGVGAALRAGLAAARYPLVCYTLGDEEYDPSNLDHLLQWIDQTDLVGGYRVISSGRRTKPMRERVLRWLARVLFAVRLRDPGCFFLLARRSIFGRIPIQSNGPFAHVEILAKANFLGCLMSETPVTFRPREGGKSPTGASFRQMLAELRRVFFRPDFGPRDVPVADPGISPDHAPASLPGTENPPV